MDDLKFSYETTCPNCGAEISSETCQESQDDKNKGYICNFCGTVV